MRLPLSADSSGWLLFGWRATAPAMVCLITMLAWPWPGWSNDYGVFIDVETEEDLLDLLSSNEIDETTYETLVEMLNDGVDLGFADRDELYALPNLTYADVDSILAYREEAGYVQDPIALVAAGALSKKKLSAIAAFLLISDPSRLPLDIRGRIRYRTTWVAGDDKVPGMWLGASVSTLKNLDAGLVGVMSRTRLVGVAHDPNRSYVDGSGRGALSAEAASTRVHLPKFYLQWETGRWHLVAGTFRIGFGQRLTFDNTGRYTPNGIRIDDTIYYSQDLSLACKRSTGELAEGPCAGEAGHEYQSPDYRWTDRLRGAGVGLKKMALGEGWLQTYGFLSFQTRSIYQYEIYDRRYCEDPRDDDDPACKAPDVFMRQDDLLLETSRFKLYTLPDMFNELTSGGNVSYFIDRRTHLGITGYGACVYWLAEGLDLDFQEWSRLPYGGPFGAIGVDGAWGSDWIDIFFELARSMDSQPEGGGYAAILRSTATWQRHEIEAAIRYYDQDYANPYARPISAADEFEGLRARDEAGLRLRYTGVLGELELHSTADFWAELSDKAPRALFRVRGDYKVTESLKPGVWVEYQDRDLGDTTRRNCYEFPFEYIEGEPVPCAGEKIQAGVQLRYLPVRRLSVTAKYQHRWVDDNRYSNRFRQDASVWLAVIYKPIDALRLLSRARYLFEDTSDQKYLEESLWVYLEAAYQYERNLWGKLRYEVYAWLDERDNTRKRVPNPAHWLRLELEYRF